MSTRRRTITTTVTVLALIGLVSTPAAVAAVRHPASSPTPVTVGQIAYVTNGEKVDLQLLGPHGAQGSPTQIGPVSKPAKGQKLQVFDLVASGDGQWVAWEEVLISKTSFKSVLVQYAVESGKTYQLRTNYAPVGFAKDELVVTNESHDKTLHLTPKPRLVKFKDSQAALAAFPDGVVDSTYTPIKHSQKHIDRLRLITFGGTHVRLHSYTLGATNYRDIDNAWVSGDAKRVVIERGNHQDFDGLGPSSLADEFSLSGHHQRTTLGHYGTDRGHWRIASVAYQGPKDTVWAIWERDGKGGPESIAATYTHGAWHKYAGKSVAVAGGTTGYLVEQPGKLVQSNPNDNGFTQVATKAAVLVHGSTRVSIGVRGPAIVWLALIPG
jgi:hypothetical protein